MFTTAIKAAMLLGGLKDQYLNRNESIPQAVEMQQWEKAPEAKPLNKFCFSDSDIHNQYNILNLSELDTTNEYGFINPDPMYYEPQYHKDGIIESILNTTKADVIKYAEECSEKLYDVVTNTYDKTRDHLAPQSFDTEIKGVEMLFIVPLDGILAKEEESLQSIIKEDFIKEPAVNTDKKAPHKKAPHKKAPQRKARAEAQKARELDQQEEEKKFIERIKYRLSPEYNKRSFLRKAAEATIAVTKVLAKDLPSASMEIGGSAIECMKSIPSDVAYYGQYACEAFNSYMKGAAK